MFNSSEAAHVIPASTASPFSQHDAIPFAALTDLWRAALLAFRQAFQKTTQPAEQFYCIGNRIIRLRFAGERLMTLLTPALAHLATVPHPTPDLTINLWDSATTGIALPPLPLRMQQPPPQYDRWSSYAHSGYFHAFYQPVYQLFTMLDSRQSEAIYWVQDANQLPITEGGAPLITLLHWWLSQQGQQIVHGAAVGIVTGGALLVGKGGSGKSTTALACLSAGMHYLGDDYCLVTTTPRPTVYSLYSSGKVHFADRTRFPHLQRAQSPNAYVDADKAIYFFAAAFANQIVPTLPLKAVLLPTINGARATSFRAVSPATALLAVGPSTVFQLIGERKQTMHHLSQLLRQLPCYQVSLGADIEQIPARIADLLSTL